MAGKISSAESTRLSSARDLAAPVEGARHAVAVAQRLEGLLGLAVADLGFLPLSPLPGDVRHPDEVVGHAVVIADLEPAYVQASGRGLDAFLGTRAGE